MTNQRVSCKWLMEQGIVFHPMMFHPKVMRCFCGRFKNICELYQISNEELVQRMMKYNKKGVTGTDLSVECGRLMEGV